MNRVKYTITVGSTLRSPWRVSTGGAVVEHNLKVALSLARRVYLMGKAHVGFTGTVAELNAQPEIRARDLEV